jgi:hypothetical protein
MTTRAHDDLLTLAKLERERDDLREAQAQARRHVERVIEAPTWQDPSQALVREMVGAAADALRWLEDAPAGAKEKQLLEDGRIRPRWLRVVPYVAGAVFLWVLLRPALSDPGWLATETGIRAGFGFLGGVIVAYWLGAWR